MGKGRIPRRALEDKWVVRGESKLVAVGRGKGRGSFKSRADANMGQYWREAGLSFLRYSNLCAEHVRRASRLDAAAQAKAATTKPWEMIKMTWQGGKVVARESLAQKK